MNLYLIELPGKGKAVVSAANESVARTILPIVGDPVYMNDKDPMVKQLWTIDPDQVVCALIGLSYVKEGCLIGCLKH